MGSKGSEIGTGAVFEGVVWGVPPPWRPRPPDREVARSNGVPVAASWEVAGAEKVNWAERGEAWVGKGKEASCCCNICCCICC